MHQGRSIDNDHTWLRRVLTNVRADAEDNRRRLYLGFCLMVTVPALAIFSIHDIPDQRPVEVVVDITAVCVLITLLFALPRVQRGVGVFRFTVSFVTVLLLYYVWSSGDRIDLVWLFPLPLGFLFLLGRKEGALWAAVLLLAVALLLLFQRGVVPQSFGSLAGLRYWVALLVVALLSIGTESLRESYHRRLAAEHAELVQALAEVETLHGLLPICANCKKIRDDQGYWSQVETYFGDRTDVHFSHGLCPECVQTLYGLSVDKDDKSKSP